MINRASLQATEYGLELTLVLDNGRWWVFTAPARPEIELHIFDPDPSGNGNIWPRDSQSFVCDLPAHALSETGRA